MKKILSICAGALLFASTAWAQPKVGYDNAEPCRNEFLPYSIRNTAEKMDRNAEQFYVPLNNMFTTTVNNMKHYRTVIDIPQVWLERELFLHTEGSRNSHRVYVNDIYIGSARDSRLPSEFNISRALRSGMNVIAVEIVPDTNEPESALSDSRAEVEHAFIYSQPRTRILDYNISFVPDSTGSHGIITADVIMANSFNYEEPLTVGFDIYSPEGQLKEYNLIGTIMEGNSTDTIRFKADIYGAMERKWSAEKPNLYSVMFYVRKGSFIIEYVPVKIGFHTQQWTPEGIVRNGQRLDLKPIRYNAAPTEHETTAEIKSFKKSGVNTIYVDYPQPYWFYEVCDREGMYVVDQANINSAHQVDDPKVGGALSNDPAWLPEFMERTRRSYYRSRHHACIIARSLGGHNGNGYNMYKTYLWLKEQDDTVPVIYRDADAQWNNDLLLPPAADR